MLRRMSKVIQIRGVPDDVHERLVTRAGRAGVSLSEYLRRELLWLASRATMSEFLAQLNQDSPVLGGPPTSQLIDEVRREADARFE